MNKITFLFRMMLQLFTATRLRFAEMLLFAGTFLISERFLFPAAFFSPAVFLFAEIFLFSGTAAAQDASFEALRVPAGSFAVMCSSFQPGAEIEKAFDGDSASIWHSRWDSENAYPYSIAVQFLRPEKLEKISYLPRQDGENGHILEYSLWMKSGVKSAWKQIQRGTFANSNTQKYITFPAQKCVALRLDVLKGTGGFGSAAEFAFYRCDESLARMDALFTDRSFTELKTNKKGQLPPDLYKKLEKMRVKEKRPEILEEIQLAERLMQKPKDLKRRAFTVIQKPSADEECSWRRGGFPWSQYQPTGLTVNEGESFAVYVEANPGDPLPNLVIHDLRTSRWEDQTSLPLTLGRNYFEAPRAGILYIENPYEAPQQVKAPVLHFEKVTPIPFYELGKTTPKEWQKMLQAPNPFGMAEFSSEHVLVSASAKNVERYLDNPETLMKTYEYLMKLYAHFLGFSEEETLPPNRRPRCVLHLIEVDHSYMYATAYRTAYHFDAMAPVLNAAVLRGDGWGPWHEIGHTHQVQQYKFQGLGEVTVNLFSLEMQTSLGQRARIDDEDMHRKIMTFFQNPNRDFHAEEDVFMKLAMFWQLRLAFGDEFYPALHRYYREHELELPDDDAKVQAFIRVSSEVSGWNLAPFFEAWGLPVEEQTLVETQRWKKLTKPVWLNMGFSQVSPKGVLGIAKH